MQSINIAEIFNQIEEKRKKPWQGEEEVRIAWVKAIEHATGLHINAERDRKDASHNHVIVEFKAPGFFRGRKTSSKFIEASQQLRKYIKESAKLTRIDVSDFIGIAIDGEHICFAQVFGENIKTQQLIPFSEYAVTLVIDAFRSDTRRALCIENLRSDFGHGSVNARKLMQSLSDGLAYELSKPDNNKVKMLFEEWRTLYGQVADMSVMQAESIVSEMAFSWNGGHVESLSARLFVIHTYNSLLIKLLAAEIIASHGLTAIEYPAQSMSVIQKDESLIQDLEYNIECSKIFESAGIKGFVEEAIFSWYLDVARSSEECSTSILKSLRQVLSVLSLYRLDKLDHTRDVLRDLYQELVPGKLRQSLGEFYTADWLVDFTLSKAQQKSWLYKRVLDPTCGSGAFLIALIRQKIIQAKALNWSSESILENICSTVWGFDLNPLAVQTARVNFLMEIASLLKDCPGREIELPILLADAIYSPAQNPQADEDVVQYKIGSQVAKLDILLPSELALNRERLDLVFSQMACAVERDLEFINVKDNLVEYQIVLPEEIEKWADSLSYTYNQVLKLHRKNWNGIWFRIVRNFFWSATAGEFDCIIGNPPWVRWSKLPEAYRERVKPTCEDYGIFSNTKRHGGNELDISAMITYAVADKWLKVDGCLAFVLTGTLFKNPSSAGFRTFIIEPSNQNIDYLQPIEVADFKNLKPFEDASNHTVVSVFKKSKKKGEYPVPYEIWTANKGERKSIPSTLSIAEVLKKINCIKKEAFPVSEELGSPWAILKPGRFASIKYLSSECTWTQGRKGITTDLNGVYFVPIVDSDRNLVKIRSRPEAGRKNIGVARTQWVEPDLLYPLIKGAGDFEACYLKLLSPNYSAERLYTFIPNKSINKQAYQDCDDIINSPKLKKTKAWFKGFESVLRDRSTYRRQMQGAPYQAIYNIGDYTFQPWKVVWPEMSSSFYAAVVGSDVMPTNGSRVFIPDHKVYYASFNDKETAYYLCGLLNTETVIEWLNSHNISIQVANIFKHLNLPEYDEKNQQHINLAALVEAAHNTHSKTARLKILEDIIRVGEEILSDWSRN